MGFYGQARALILINQALDSTAEKATTAGSALEGQTSESEKLLEHEQAVARVLSDAVENANKMIESANTALDEMSEKAGVTDKSGAGAKVKDLNAELNEARNRLQYLQDTNASGSAISDQSKTVDSISKQLDEAEKNLRVTTYEFQHSDAYKEQLAAIQKAKDEAAEAKRQAEEEQAKLQQLQTDQQKMQLAITDGITAEGEELVKAAEAVRRGPITVAVKGILKAGNDAAQAIADSTDKATQSITTATDDATTSLDQATNRALSALEQLQQFAGGNFASEGFDSSGNKTGGAVSYSYAYQLVQQYAQLLALTGLDPQRAVQRERDELVLQRLFSDWFGTRFGRIEDLAKQLLAQSSSSGKAPIQPRSTSANSTTTTKGSSSGMSIGAAFSTGRLA